MYKKTRGLNYFIQSTGLRIAKDFKGNLSGDFLFDHLFLDFDQNDTLQVGANSM